MIIINLNHKVLRATLTLLLITLGSVSAPFADYITFTVEQNRTLVPVTIGNSRTLSIILDTGMILDGLLIYNPSLIDSISLPEAIPVRVPGAGGGPPSEGFMTDSAAYSIDTTVLTNQRIIMLSSGPLSGFNSDGVLGHSIFGHFRVSLNYDHNLLRLFPPDSIQVDSTWVSIPLYFKSNTIPWMDIMVAIDDQDPVPISVYIDLASGDAIELLDKPGMKYKLPEVTKEAYLGTGLSGDIYGHRGVVSEVRIGPFTLTDVSAAIAPAHIRSKQPGADAIIGNDLLRRFNIIFDYQKRQLYIKPNQFFGKSFYG